MQCKCGWTLTKNLSEWDIFTIGMWRKCPKCQTRLWDTDKEMWVDFDKVFPRKRKRGRDNKELLDKIDAVNKLLACGQTVELTEPLEFPTTTI